VLLSACLEPQNKGKSVDSEEHRKGEPKHKQAARVPGLFGSAQSERPFATQMPEDTGSRFWYQLHLDLPSKELQDLLLSWGLLCTWTRPGSGQHGFCGLHMLCESTSRSMSCGHLRVDLNVVVLLAHVADTHTGGVLLLVFATVSPGQMFIRISCSSSPHGSRVQHPEVMLVLWARLKRAPVLFDL
jgi:hypothetical protein